jgi:6-phospho-beta-glucosidase
MMLRFAILGGGVSVAPLCTALAAAAAVSDRFDIRVHAHNAYRLRLICTHCAHLLSRLGRTGWTVTACSSAAEAVSGAAAIALLVRVGGLAARARDEEFPAAFGIPGDEGLGPGGYANALRTLPVLDRMSHVIRKHAPAAKVFNLMAPLGLSTRLLLERELDAVGVCELPSDTECALVQACGAAARPLHYAGLNHLGWFAPSTENAGEFFSGALRKELADAATVARYGAVPLKYYYSVFDTSAGRRLGMNTVAGRARRLMDMNEAVLRDFAVRPGEASPAQAERPTPWLAGALVPMLIAHLGGIAWDGYANVANSGLAPDVPASAVIETRVTLSSAALIAEPWPQAFSRPVREFLAAMGHADDLAYRAWREERRTLLEEAVQVLPYGLDPAVASLLADAIFESARCV